MTDSTEKNLPAKTEGGSWYRNRTIKVNREKLSHRYSGYHRKRKTDNKPQNAKGTFRRFVGAYRKVQMANDNCGHRYGHHPFLTYGVRI